MRGKTKLLIEYIAELSGYTPNEILIEYTDEYDIVQCLEYNDKPICELHIDNFTGFTVKPVIGKKNLMKDTENNIEMMDIDSSEPGCENIKSDVKMEIEEIKKKEPKIEKKIMDEELEAKYQRYIKIETEPKISLKPKGGNDILLYMNRIINDFDIIDVN